MGHDQCVAVILPCFGGITLRISFLLHRSQLGKAAARFDLAHGFADRCLHLVRVHRLEQVITGTQMHGLVGILEQAVGRDKDHLALRAIFGCLNGDLVLKAAGNDIRQSFSFQYFVIRDQQANHSSNSSSFSTNGRYSTTAVPRPGWDRITRRLFRSSRRRRAATL